MDFKQYVLNQKIEIERFKYIESQKAGKDLGEDAVREWVNKYAAQYRKEYNEVYCCFVNKVVERVKTVLQNPDEQTVKVIVDIFVETWSKELILNNDPKVKAHLAEI